jgi:hypothetical protein
VVKKYLKLLRAKRSRRLILHFHVAARDIQLVLELFPVCVAIVGRSGVLRGGWSVGLGVGESARVKLGWLLLQVMPSPLSVIRLLFHLRRASLFEWFA